MVNYTHRPFDPNNRSTNHVESMRQRGHRPVSITGHGMMETMSAACCLIARVHRNRTITPADKVRAPDLEGCRRAFTSPVSAFECAFWDGTPGLCTRRPDRIPLDRARWVWQSPCGLIKIVTYTGTEFVISCTIEPAPLWGFHHQALGGNS